MADGSELDVLIEAIVNGDGDGVRDLIRTRADVVHDRLPRGGERFADGLGAQLYEGDTALHVAAGAHDADIARLLLDHGADVGARNRRGASPLHTATTGQPGGPRWDPGRQRATIVLLVAAGAEVDAAAAGGVTPLHRAVRNRCADAVEALLQAGADPQRANDRGSTAIELTRTTSGRSGSGSPAARAELARIVALLAR